MDKLITCVCVIIIILLLDMIFDVSSSITTEYFDSTPPFFNLAKSIRSKVDGILINIQIDDVEKKNTDPKSTIINIKIPIDNDGHYLDYDKNGSEISFTSENDSKWILNKITTVEELNTITQQNTNAGYSTDKVDLNNPFYMITHKEHNDKALQYSNGNLLCVSVGNYDSQKWDISDETIPKKQLVLKNIYETPIGQMARSSSADNENRIKLNLNFNNEKLKQLFNDNNTSETPQQCDTYLPKSAVKSLCPGCEY